MRFMICFYGKHKVKIFNRSDTLDSLIMILVICNAISERIASENGMEVEDALKFLIDSIYESYDSLKLRINLEKEN